MILIFISCVCARVSGQSLETSILRFGQNYCFLNMSFQGPIPGSIPQLPPPSQARPPGPQTRRCVCPSTLTTPTTPYAEASQALPPTQSSRFPLRLACRPARRKFREPPPHTQSGAPPLSLQPPHCLLVPSSLHYKTGGADTPVSALLLDNLR